MKKQTRRSLVEENIEKLRTGRAALKGTRLTEDVIDLRRVLVAAFNEDHTACTGGWDYYMADEFNKNFWTWSKTNKGLEEIPLDEFFEKQELWQTDVMKSMKQLPLS